MFTFADEDFDFYLPQILNMYIYMHDVAEAVHPYLLHRYTRVTNRVQGGNILKPLSDAIIPEQVVDSWIAYLM